MNEHNYLARNLRNYKELRQMTMKELAREIDIPISTLRTIMKEGNTTLHTAIRISRGLGISMDMLISDQDFPDKLFIMDQMQRAGEWFGEIPPEKGNDMARLIAEIWEVIGRDQR